MLDNISIVGDALPGALTVAFQEWKYLVWPGGRGVYRDECDGHGTGQRATIEDN